MTEEIDKRTFLQLLGVGAVSGLAACATTADPDTGQVVPDGELVASQPGGGAVPADGINPTFKVAESTDAYLDDEPDGPTLYLVLAGAEKGTHYHEP